MAEQGQKSGFFSSLGQAWLVLALAGCFGTALAVVERFTRPRIEANVKQRIAEKLVEMFGAGTTTADPTVVEAAIEGRPQKVDCYPALKAGKLDGWGILAVGKGYDTLTLLVGLSPDGGTLRGYRVVKSLETPGIGDKIKPEVSDFYKQFVGQGARKPLELVRPGAPAGPNQIHGISGATISSKGVVATINEYVQAVGPKLAAMKPEASNQPAAGEGPGARQRSQVDPLADVREVR